MGTAMMFGILAVQLLYHFGPDLKQHFRDSLNGAIVAVMTWVGLSYLLGSYFDISKILIKRTDRSVPPSACTCGFTSPVRHSARLRN